MRTIKNFLVGCGLVFLATLFDLHARRQDMSRDTKKVIKWWLIAVFAVGVIRLLSGCARPITIPEPTLYPYRIQLAESLPGGAYGITGCDTILDQPVVVIQTTISEKPDGVTVLAHEAEHVRQMATVGQGRGCRAFMENYQRDPKFRFLSEVLAYCQGALVGVRVLHWDYEEVMKVYAGFVYDTRRLPNQARDEVLAIMLTTCQEVQNAAKRKAPP